VRGPGAEVISTKSASKAEDGRVRFGLLKFRIFGTAADRNGHDKLIVIH